MASKEMRAVGVGLVYHPATIVLDYVVIATGKRRRRKMPVRNVDEDDDAVADALVDRHSRYVLLLQDSQLMSLIGKLKSGMKAHAAKNSSNRVVAAAALLGDLDENLNVLSEDELQERKKRMDVLFEQNRIHRDDDDFQYNVEKDFKPSKASEWDEDDDDENEASDASEW
eukprot:m.188532 g.188532  ORF g.188532 m.188532 type:complete len:170 (+) comp17537_c6_seq3:50-559(+)